MFLIQFKMLENFYQKYVDKITHFVSKYSLSTFLLVYQDFKYFLRKELLELFKIKNVNNKNICMLKKERDY